MMVDPDNDDSINDDPDNSNCIMDNPDNNDSMIDHPDYVINVVISKITLIAEPS